ncbi:Receptor-like protein kinase [Thalictrum thalictroides]|uniref:non-specific serine/threonine protein kinase n=1 Tax=Thalictrum thalictroides TaxID=46969 RepID=A0A7J6VJ20_THATH|nr:Receptor-like protein kinase [Thalictrum thalictroides]
MKFKESFKQSNVLEFDSWRFGVSPCNFSGVFCNSDQFVTRIELSNKILIGNLEFESICQLQSLEKLDLGFNNLSGIITDDLKNCTKLRFLDISMNFFNGAVPDLSSLRELEDLRLNDNGFTGQFPWKSLESLTNLTVLSVGDNPFDISSFPLEVLKLKKLKRLFLTNCSLMGRIPEGIGNLTEMENLELSTNYLTGEIPEDIVKLTKLYQLQLYANDLYGKIPVGFGNLIQLVDFDASNNSLEGDLSEIKPLERLKSLQLYENHFSGNIPHEFGDFKNLEGLSLYSNKFTGTLPQSIGSWSNFDFIDVSDNLLTGPIPPNMCKNGVMTYISMINNQFTGGIPNSYSTCSTLSRIRVSNNSLTGNVPAGIWGLPNLDFIDLAMNQFEGPVTADIVNARSLTQIRAQNNRFSGNLPMEISKASSLVSIDLSFNQLSGAIPVDIGELKKLNSLYLQENMFSGTIPSSLGECTSLNIMNLAENSFSSQIPDTLGSLSGLNSLNLSRNQLSGQIPSSLSNLKLSLLDLSNNMLTGPVPESLSIQANNGSFIGNPGLCSQSIQYFRECSNKSSHNIRILISCFLTGTIVLLISFAGFIFFKKKHNEQVKSFKSDSWQIKSFTRLSFCEKEILNLIKQENLIGKGGSGNVYRVVLGSGVELAVKHIWNTLSSEGNRSSTAMLMKRSGNLSEFEAEVATLSSIRHVNVVKLYCSITSEDSSLLVYEYLPNGSLWDRLHTTCDDDKLDWETRYEIAVGAAKGLEYLHHGCDRPVIHHDVKSSNILLDEFFKPRIADFGLAKTVQSNSTNSSTHLITGTHGYIAPEYAYTCKVNEKSDVYSFGVVLIELVTGKKAIEAEFGENKDIVDWVCRRMARGENIVELLDNSIPEVFKEYALKVLRIGVICTARLPALRPSMRTVVQMLLDAEPCKLIDIICQDDGSKKEIMVSDEKLKYNSV